MSTASIPDSVEHLLQAMVNVDTVNGHISGRSDAEAPLAELLERVAKAMGFDTQRLPVDQRGDNLVVLHETAPDRPWLVFESHMDTVAVAGMTVDPFAGEIRDGRLWGRGACDTKGTGAAMLHALREYARGGDRPNNVAIAFTVDEEIGMTGVRALIRQLPELGIRPRGVIVGEPTKLEPIVAHNGAVRWTITTRGVAAHSANPSLGRSAITAMCHVVRAIETGYIPNLTAEHPMTGLAQCSINTIQGGVQENIVPDRCVVSVDRRVVPGEDPHAVIPAVQGHLDELRQRVPDLDVEQSEAKVFPPLSDDRNGPLLGLVQGALTTLGLPEAAQGVGYATDAGDLSAAGIAALVIGPGDIAQAHTKDEWIDLEQLRRGADVYLAIMRAAG